MLIISMNYNSVKEKNIFLYKRQKKQKKKRKRERETCYPSKWQKSGNWQLII